MTTSYRHGLLLHLKRTVWFIMFALVWGEPRKDRRLSGAHPVYVSKNGEELLASSET